MVQSPLTLSLYDCKAGSFGLTLDFNIDGFVDAS